MPEGSSRVYTFRNFGGDGSGFGPPLFSAESWRKLLIIGGVILGLYMIHLYQMGSTNALMTFIEYVIWLPILLFSLTTHEFAHAAMADFLGDPTARKMGRLSLNPLRHLDFLGTMFMLMTSFGWAKPVPVNPEYFRVPGRAMMSVALAGPFSNFLLAVLGGGVLKILVMVNMSMPVDPLVAAAIKYFAMTMIGINLGLGCFNLLPINPLDGSKVLHFLLTPAQRVAIRGYEESSGLIMMLLLVFGLVGMVLRPMVTAGYHLILGMYGLI